MSDKRCRFGDTLTQSSITIWPFSNSLKCLHPFFLLLTHQPWGQNAHLLPNISHHWQVPCWRDNQYYLLHLSVVIMLYLIGVFHFGKVKSSDFLSKNPKENHLFLKILKEHYLAHFPTIKKRNKTNTNFQEKSCTYRIDSTYLKLNLLFMTENHN